MSFTLKVKKVLRDNSPWFMADLKHACGGTDYVQQLAWSHIIPGRSHLAAYEFELLEALCDMHGWDIEITNET